MEYIKIGHFLKTHGIEGSLMLSYDPRWATALENSRVVMVEAEGLPVPWFVSDEGITMITPGTALVNLDWIEDEQSARKLCGHSVLLEKRAMIPEVYAESVNEQNLNPENWKGYKITAAESGFSGVIKSVDNYSGNLVFTVATGDKTTLLPYHDDLLVAIDHEEKRLELRLPDGILHL